MEVPPRDDVVCLHLDGVEGDARTDPAPPECTIRGIAEALGLDDERTAERVGLLSTLAELEAEGLVGARTGTVAGSGRERTVYWATERGRERAAAVRERLADETVELTDPATEEVPVRELDRYFEDRPIVRALAGRTADGRVAVEADRGGEFVDREDELARLEGVVERARDHGSRTVLVAGEAGIGKTTLVERALDTARGAGFDVGTAACRRGGTEPFGPLVAAFRELDGGDAVAAPLGEQPREGGTDPSAAERDALFDAVADALRERAAEGPLVVFLDDLQWADPATLSLFVHLSESVTEWIYPVAFVAAYRVEEAAGDGRLEAAVDRLTDGDRREELSLGPLPEEDTRGLVAWLADEPAVPEAFVALVADHSGGNPLLLRETVRYLLAEGELDPAAGRYPTAPDDLGVPADLRTVVRSRLEPLPEPVRAVLEVAAVAGDPVEPALLAAALDLDEATVNDRLDLLAAGRLLEWRGDRVAFVGDVVREVLLADLEGDRRRRLHRRIADAVPAVAEGERTDRAARVARHRERAGDRERALAAYRRAAERAMDVYAHDLAVEHYEAGLAVARELNDDAAATELLVGLGRAEYHRGGYDAAERRLEAATERADDPEPFMEAAYYRARVHFDRGDYGATLDAASAGLDRWDGGALVPAVPRLLSRKGWALQQSGRVEAAREAFERELELARELGDDRLLGRALHDVGSIELIRGDEAAVVDTYETAMEVLERAGARRRLARAKHNLGLGYKHRGDLRRAARVLSEALSVQRELGDESGATTTLANLGEVEFMRGDWERARERYEAGLESARALDKQRIEAVLTGDLGELELARGNLDAAEDHFLDCIERCRRLGHDRQLAGWQAQYARLRHLRGDLADARERAEAALALAEDLEVNREVALARDALGRVERAAGNLGAAVRHQERAVDGAPDLTVPLGRTLLAADRPVEATETAREAVEATERDAEPLRWLRAVALLGATHRERGDLDRADHRLLAALEEARDVGARVEECRILHDRGLLERARGDEAAARTELGSARDIAEEMGAALLADRCRAALDER